MISPKSFHITVLIAALVAIGPLSTDMYLPAFPTLMQVFAVDIDQVQGTLSIFLVGFAIAQLGYGPLSDKFGRKPVLLVGLALFVISSIGIVLVESIESLSLMRLLQAIGGSAGPVLGRAMVRDIHGPRESARLLSYLGTVMALAPAVAPILGGYMTVWFGWKSIFLLLGVYGLLGILFLTVLIPETAPSVGHQLLNTQHRLLQGYQTLLRHQTWRWYTLCCSFVFCGLFAFLSGSSFVIIDFLGYPEQQFGLFFTLVVFGYMSGTLIGGKLVHRVGIHRLLGFGALFSAAGGLIMLLLAIFKVHHIYAIILPHMLYMFGTGFVMPQAIAGALAPFPQMAGTASALLGFIQMILAAMVGILVGHYHDGSPLSMASAIGRMGLLTLLSFIALSRTKSRELVDLPNEIS